MAKRIFLIGGPDTGKTTLSEQLAVQHGIKHVLHTDDLIGHGWSEASQAAADWMNEHANDDYIIEGTAAIRGLRKWLRQNEGPLPEGTTIYTLNLPYVPQSKGQRAMSLGVLTITTEIYSELISRGAVFEQHKSDTGNG